MASFDITQFGLLAVVAVVTVVAFAAAHRWLSSASKLTALATSTKSATNHSTCRIRGVPIDWDIPRLQSYLAEHVGAASIDVISLAAEIDGRSLTGTATYSGHHPQQASLELSPDQTGRRQYLTIDHDFLGITTLYAPPRADHELDVISVSGLGGHAFGSFKERNGAHMWLRDSLPNDLTDRDSERPMARIMVYGHDSRVAESNSMQDLEDMSISFRESLLPLMGTPTLKPVILIGHSLGGLIVKQALASISASPSEPSGAYKRFARAIHGIIFFGVPHDGMEINSLRKMAGNMLNRSLIESLGRENSSVLANLRRHFNKMLDEFSDTDIFSFYETEMSNTPRQDANKKWTMDGQRAILVSKSSATRFRASECDPLEACAIARSHSDIVKFCRHDNEYDKVRERLRIFAQRAVIPKCLRQNDDGVTVPIDPLTKECLRLLAFPEMDYRLNDIDTAANDTCGWLREHAAYEQWSSAHRGLLWIKGKPGSGKSTLLRYILDHYKANPVIRNGAALVSFFFHGRGTELQKTLLGFFRSVLHQILRQIPAALQDMVAAFKNWKDLVKNEAETKRWHEKELRGFLKGSLSKILKRRSLWLFVDALDESGKENAIELVKDFESLLREVPSAGGQFHICFTCRHYPIVGGDRAFNIYLEDENADDISTYVRAHLSQSSYMAGSTIPIMITERANGVFMWARLVVQKALELDNDGHSLATIKNSIESIPPELDEVYARLVEDMDDKEVSLKLFQWICFATRPISLDEMRWALVVDFGSSRRTLQQYQDRAEYIPDNERMEKRLKVLSRGLAEVSRRTLIQYLYRTEYVYDNELTEKRLEVQERCDMFSDGPATVVDTSEERIIQFIHQSARDFFINKGLLALDSNMGWGSSSAITANRAVGMAHFGLARTCVRYLAMEEISQTTARNSEITAANRIALTKKFHLLAYATVSWVTHVKESEARGIPQDDILEYFLWPSECLLQL
ncbi:Vegetative incompatibility protein HET-E-1 [Tolypocladium ophioglossoides CBS 100239]|uniref:Vegetative incompatibility protein HET-E-1 n=1 Tax=Tolypocladium ophioglossoides (strain CBS 100239) TaxID=1163406 RepID=A0A0L0MZI3_TOLOC|nr:Vegetative incompatibility protein HET-E-1 [Tolypocladium ophioglossoides CBS 100239]